MNNLKPVAALAVFLMACQGLFASKDQLQLGLNAFNNNQRSQAIELFKKAAADATTKADANLALSLLYWSEDKTDEGFKAFVDFFNASPNPYPYLYALWSAPIVFDGDGKKKDAQLELLKRILNDPKANGTLQAMAYSLLGKHYEAIGDFKKANEQYAKIGAISNWQVLGTFDNTSGSGFNKDFRVLNNPEPDAIFKNKVDADISWFIPPAERSDKWFDFDFYLDIHNSIMYAQSYLQSDAEQEVYFKSGCSGSIKIWVNDKLVTNQSDERNCDLDIYTNNVKLNKGYNRVLVQIGESEAGRANFMIRVTDKDGHPVKGLTSTTDFQQFKPSENYTVNSLTFFAEDFFDNKVKVEPTLINYLMLAEVYLRNDKVYEARKALKKAQELAPGNSFVSTRLIEAYVRDNDVTDVTKEYEKIKSEDTDAVYTLKGLIEEARQKENYDEEERLMAKYIAIYGEDEYTDLLALNISASRNKYDEIVSASKRLYAKYPDNLELMNLSYTIERNASKDLAKADDILKSFLKNNYSDKVLTTLASNYFDLGNKREAYEIYNKRIENYPYSIGYYTELSDIYFGAQDYDNALKMSKKALEFAPYVGAYWNKLGSIYQAMNKTNEAKDAFSKAIYYTPTNYEARRQLRKLEGKKDLFENFQKTDAYALYKNSPKAEDNPDDNSMVLLNEVQKVVYAEGASEEKTEILVKVFNQNGIDTWKEYSVPYNRYRQRLIIDKAEVLKKDGNKVQAEKNEGTLVFTNLEAGDAIHVSYKIEDYNTGKLARQFWEQFNFNVDFPVKLARYSLLLPAKEVFQSQVLHSSIKPTSTDVEGNMKLYVWEAKDQPAIKPEAFMPPISDVGAILDISTIPDWKYVSNWYSDLSTNLAKTDFEIKETVANLLQGKTGLNQLEKAKLIYKYIEDNVSYSNVPFMHGPIIPQKASRTLSTKLGDCKDVSTLFVAMCKEAGLKANLVLVDTKDNGLQHLSLPSIDFDHCVAQIIIDGKKYYVELTDQQLSFGTIPTIDLNSNILFIPRDGDTAATQLSSFNSTSRTLNGIIRESEMKFDSNDVILNRHNIKTGMFAAQMRTDYDNQGKDKQEKMISQALASDFTTPTKLLKLNIGDLKKLSDTVSYDYSFDIKNHLTEVVGFKIFRIPWSEGVRSLDFLALETRKYPFLVWAYNASEVCKETMVIDLPKGKVLAEQPKTVNLSCSAADYSLTYTLSKEKDKLTCVRELKFKKDVVAPTDYGQFKDFFNKVAEADSKQIGFK